MKLNQVCYRTKNLACDEPWSLTAYESLGGYQVLRRVLREQTPPNEIIEEIKKSQLRGRGGAGFPTGLKWSFIKRDHPKPKYVICNADESEPGTFKDRDILIYNPHQLLEGLAIACYVLGAHVAYNFLRGEFYLPLQRCEHALQEMTAAGLCGANVQNSGYDIFIFNHISAGAYICGEETALMNSLEGKKPWPRYKPPFPAQAGLYGCPTNINNVETFASVPVILQNGGEWFAALGSGQSGGTKIFCVSGHVNQPGNYEIPLGTPFVDLLALAGGVLDGRKLKAVIPGGTSMPIVPAKTMLKVNMDYESLVAAGSMLGSGGVIVMDETTDIPQVLETICKFYKHESCGQCTPCREGTGWLYRLIQQINRGQGGIDDLAQLKRVADGIEGRTICAFGEAAAWPVQACLKRFYPEFERKVCMTGMSSPFQVTSAYG